ncbi:MAG: tandem-95 repeat protein, partial [Chitinophagaceae bacterium]
KKWLKDRIEWMDIQFNYNQEKFAPITSDLHFIVNEDEKTTFDLVSYGKINNNEAFEVVQQSSRSQLSFNDKKGQIIYTPENNFYGLDTLKYRYFDGELWSDTSIVILEILPVNDEPIIENSITDSLLEDSQLNINADNGLLCCISDPDDNAFTIENYVEPKLGGIELNKDGSFRYTPIKDIYGVDTVFFTIKNTSNQIVSSFRKLLILPVNDQPIIKNIDLETDEDSLINIKIDKKFINDVDDTLHSVFIINKPRKGEAKIINANELTYSPNENFYGIDSLQIKAKDQNDSSNVGTIKITVNPVNDKPYSTRDLFFQAKTEDTLHLFLKDILSAIIDPDDDTLRIYNTDDINKDFKISETQTELTLFIRNKMPGIYRKQIQITDNKAEPADLKLTIRILPDPKKSNFESIKLFPNPTSGIVNINDLEIDQVKIFDAKGLKILDKRIYNKITNNCIDLFGISKGIYKVAIFNKNQLIAIKSIIIN